MSFDVLKSAVTAPRLLAILIAVLIRRQIFCAIGLASRVKLEHGPDSISVGKRKLVDIVRDCPSLYGDRAVYVPTPGLGGGHAATIFSAAADFTHIDRLDYERRLLRLPDGGTISLDFTPPFEECPADDRPILICIHGLTGGSHESYVRSVLSNVTASKESGGLGWRGLVVNARGCADTPITTKQIFHAGWTLDLKRAVFYVSTIMPNAPLYGIGFSLGANILCRYLGEEGDQTPLKAAIAASSPWDLWKGHVALSSSSMGRLYSRAMSKNLRMLVKRHLKMFEDDPRLDLNCVFGNENATLYEFDAQVTRKLGGFDSAEHYYTTQSATRNLDQVRIPVLGLHALNDPITARSVLPTGHHPHFVLATTSQGGHLGWWSGFRKQRWLPKPVCEFFSGIHAADSMARPHSTSAIAGKDGLTVDRDRREVGFRVIDAGEKIAGGDDAGERGIAGTMKGF